MIFALCKMDGVTGPGRDACERRPHRRRRPAVARCRACVRVHRTARSGRSACVRYRGTAGTVRRPAPGARRRTDRRCRRTGGPCPVHGGHTPKIAHHSARSAMPRRVCSDSGQRRRLPVFTALARRAPSPGCSRACRWRTSPATWPGPMARGRPPCRPRRWCPDRWCGSRRCAAARTRRPGRSVRGGWFHVHRHMRLDLGQRPPARARRVVQERQDVRLQAHVGAGAQQGSGGCDHLFISPGARCRSAGCAQDHRRPAPSGRRPCRCVR
jgi:hypothetical protein